VVDFLAVRPPHEDVDRNLEVYQQSGHVTAEFGLRSGERATFVFGGVRAPGERPEMEFVEQRFRETARFWRGWIAKSKYKGKWSEMVNR
jgi:hypothetical protein